MHFLLMVHRKVSEYNWCYYDPGKKQIAQDWIFFFFDFGFARLIASSVVTRFLFAMLCTGFLAMGARAILLLNDAGRLIITIRRRR